MPKATIKLNPVALQLVLRKDERYYLYMDHVGHELIRAAAVVFTTFDKRFNEGRTSEYTPPKYLASFRVRVYRQALKVHAVNTDPGWVLVEWGAHPGGGQTQVLRYKPLTRALIIVGARWKGRP